MGSYSEDIHEESATSSSPSDDDQFLAAPDFGIITASKDHNEHFKIVAEVHTVDDSD